jgi:hypothetical protein
MGFEKRVQKRNIFDLFIPKYHSYSYNENVITTLFGRDTIELKGGYKI